MRIYTLAIAFLFCTAADAQIIRAEPFYTAPVEPAVYSYVIDDYPGASMAYSLRKLDNNYSGSAIRVRRSSDNTEQNIGFVNNYLDTASMKTFVGNNNGFVVTWYNQADSAGVFGVRNATQGTAANQPQIIANGAINYEGGDVVIKFDGSNDFLPAAGGEVDFTGTDKMIFSFIVQKSTFNSTQQALYGFGNTANIIPLRWLGASDANSNFRMQERDLAGTISTTSGGTATNYTLVVGKTNMDNGELFVNGTSIFTKTMNAGATTLNNFSIGSLLRTAREAYYNGVMNEMIIYPTDQSSNRTAIESNINSFYSIY